MKKFFSLILVASALITASYAQKPRMEIAKQTLMDSLKVSSSVADSIISIRQQDMTQVKAIMSDQSLSQDQKKEKAKPIKEDMKTRLKKILTDDQIAKLQEMQKAMRGKKDE